MYNERKLHVKPWRGGKRRQVYGRWPTVVGWLCILTPVLAPTVLLSESARFILMMWVIGAIPWVSLLTAPFTVAATIILVQGGIYLLRRKPRARRLLLQYAVVTLAIQGLTIVYLLTLAEPYIGLPHLSISVGWLLIPSLAFSIWPLILLLLLNSPGVRAQMDAWPGAAREETQTPPAPRT